MSTIQVDIEWTDAASARIAKLFGNKAKSSKDGSEVEPPKIGLPPLQCMPCEGDVLFLGPTGKQQAFVVIERQYHHDGADDWTIVLILDNPES